MSAIERARPTGGRCFATLGWAKVLLILATAAWLSAVAARSEDKKPSDNIEKFVNAAAVGNLDDVKRALANGVDVNGRSKSGLTALQAAKILGQTETIDLLKSKGADGSASWPDLAKVCDALVSSRVKENSPGIAVLAAKDGKILFQKAYGYANLEHRVPATVETKFRIGSVSKQFTAAAILKLVEDGKLKLDDPLTKFVPGFPKGDKVTIHHLLTHTSGIHSYTSKPDFMKKVRNYIEPRDLIKNFKDDPYDFEPGEKWQYNNSGFFLLGHIVEKISGKSFAQYLKETFFDPLGMKNTGVHHWSDILPHEAHGYQFENGKLQKAENWDMSWAGGAGALYSTVGDLFLWNEAVFGGKVLKSETLKSAFTAVLVASDPKDKPKENGYGYGWALGNARGLREISHGGGLHGFSSFLLRLPSEHFTAAVLVNALPPPSGLDAAGIAHEIASIYLWEKMKARPVFAAKKGVDAKLLEAYVGRYDYGAAVMTITRDGGRLYAQLTGQPRFEIFPKTESEFFWKVVDAQVTFVKNDKGEVTKALHKQGGQTIDAARIPETPIVKLDPKILAAYVGKYSLGAGVFDVTADGDRLFAQLTGQPKFELFATSESEFLFKVVHAKVKFVKDNAGKVTKALVEQAGMKFEAPRRADGD